MNKTSNKPNGFSTSRLDALTRRMQTDIDAGRIPGVVMLVARDGALAYEQALGTQDPATGAPMRLDTIFRIYSMTKPIVSVATMMMVGQGRLLLNEPISRLLPELRHLNVGVESFDANGQPVLELVPARQPITVQDLLRHTSGFTYGIFGDSLVKAEYRKASVPAAWSGSNAFINMLAQLPLAYQPGTTWEYSHSTDVLGVLLERLSGMPLNEFLQETILAPLGMHETGFWVEPQHHHRIAEAFPVDPVTGADVRLNQPRQRPGFFGGGGGMMSTLRDYFRFVQMLANDGELDGVRILGRKTLRHMTSDHLIALPAARAGANFLPGAGYGFGLGFAVRTDEGGSIMPGSVGDYSWSGLAGTYFWIDPQEKLLAIFLMQAPEQRDHYRQMFRNMVYAALE